LLRGFEYLRPETLKEALALAKKYGKKAKFLAGGTDLLIFISHGRVKADYVIDLKGIPGIGGIKYDAKKGLQIGALTTVREVETSPIVIKRYPILTGAATQEFASIQIRNLATIGGNVCNAAPSADTVPALMALGARAKVVGSSGRRTVPLDEFFTGPGKTVLKADEILSELVIPPPARHTGGHYIKLAARRAMDIAFVGVAAAVQADPKDGAIKDVKIVLGAVAPTPVRALEAERILKGNPLESRIIEEAGEAAEAASRPISDVRASAEYRREMVRVLTKRAVAKAWDVARNGGRG
jgi:carbon-monoxide dehydrogenase medium subunit